MKRGDLVEYLGRHWVVAQYDSKRTRTAVLLAADGTQTEVPHDLDAVGSVTVIANPSEDWPFITMPEKNGYRIASVLRLGVALAPTLDWVASDPARTGGPVFFNPALGLRYGDVLLARYVGVKVKQLATVRVDIPKDFGTVKQRVARAEAARPKQDERKNAFTRLLSDDQIGDDD